MDTVVGEEMAKTLALEGGIGFLHRNSSIAEQAARVRYVKTRHSYVIEQPLFLARTATIAEARAAIRKHNASSFLIEEAKGSGRLAGILSHRDMPLDAASDARPVSDFMTPRQRLVTRPPSVSLEEAERAMFEHRVEKLPLVDEQGRMRGLVTMRDLKLYKQKPHSTKDARGPPAGGGGGRGRPATSWSAPQALVEQEVDVLLLDVAHADSEVGGGAVRALPEAVGEGPARRRQRGDRRRRARRLADLGVDAIKVGVGPGRGCRTRLETGAGVPQLQAIREAYLATEGKVPIIADGGIRDDKDLFLAIACGASTVMLGSLLSGTDEAPGHRRGGPGHAAEDEALPRHDLAGGGGGRRGGRRARGGPAHAGRGAVGPRALRRERRRHPRPHRAGTCSRRSATRARRACAPRTRRSRASPARFLVPLSEASRRESFVR